MLAHQRGSALIELLIATLVVGVVITAVASGLTYSVKNTAESRSREVATSLAQEGLEFLRRERDTKGWTFFQDTLFPDTLAVRTYCIPTTTGGLGSLISSPCSSSNPSHKITTDGLPGSAFYREAEVEKVLDGEGKRVRVIMTVSWDAGSNQPRSTELVKEFTNW
jgi:type II secretory pathway pseudopilin PulG